MYASITWTSICSRPGWNWLHTLLARQTVFHFPSIISGLHTHTHTCITLTHAYTFDCFPFLFGFSSLFVFSPFFGLRQNILYAMHFPLPLPWERDVGREGGEGLPAWRFYCRCRWWAAAGRRWRLWQWQRLGQRFMWAMRACCSSGCWRCWLDVGVFARTSTSLTALSILPVGHLMCACVCVCLASWTWRYKADGPFLMPLLQQQREKKMNASGQSEVQYFFISFGTCTLQFRQRMMQSAWYIAHSLAYIHTYVHSYKS